MDFEYKIAGGDFARAGSASSEVKKILKQLNLDPKIIKKIAVAMYEAEVNVVAHAYRGVMKVTIEPEKIVVNIEDEGPGIPDIERAMTAGFSTASPIVREMGFGAGMGLPNIKKNSDVLDIKSTEGKGTTVNITCFIS
ncbi:MAG: anti-sigma regulatory factor [Bacteroidales bacterium]|nr:anti-sigma regulatory factor [Bacteroidales bacterium]